MIELLNISKQYNSIKAVDSLDIQILNDHWGSCPTCELTNAEWTITETTEAEIVGLVVEGNGHCDWQMVDFSVTDASEDTHQRVTIRSIL